MTLRSVSETVAWGKNQVSHPSHSWKGLCQQFVRSCMGTPSWAPSAYDAWLKIPAQYQNHTPYNEIPAGAAVYFKRNHAGAERPGHVVLSLGGGKCLSNDIKRSGEIDQVNINVFPSAWNMVYLGWSFWTPFGFEPKG